MNTKPRTLTPEGKRKLLEGYLRYRKKHPEFFREIGRRTIRQAMLAKKKQARMRNPRRLRIAGRKKKYWVIERSNGSRVPLHRLVMQKFLRRKLQPDERIRHKNGNGFDNRPENLEVYLRRETAIISALNGKWTRKFDQCVICHSRQYRNASKGVCWNCYKHIRKPGKRRK
jgi:hypothetical protein